MEGDCIIVIERILIRHPTYTIEIQPMASLRSSSVLIRMFDQMQPSQDLFETKSIIREPVTNSISIRHNVSSERTHMKAHFDIHFMVPVPSRNTHTKHPDLLLSGSFDVIKFLL